MAEPKKTPELIAESLRALERYEQKQEALAGERARPPALGDVYVLDPTRDFHIEWVLVANDPADPDCFLAVPADGNFLAGSADLELGDDSAVGSLRLRCRFGTWIDATLLKPELRVGVLGSDEVSRARQKWREVGDGVLTAPVLAREVDDDPEYKDWVEEVLIPARRALLEAQAAVIARPRRPPRYTFYRIAASIVLMLGGGLAGLELWRLNERVRDLETVSRSAEERHREQLQELEAERDRLEAERERLIAEHRRELEQAGAEDAQAGRELRERIAELDKRLQEVARASSVVNPVIAHFESPRIVTRGKKKITLDPGASHVVLFLTLDERSPAPKYRLELREKGSEVPAWTNDLLTVMEFAEIRVGVPAGILSPGVYELELSALEGGEVRRVGEYELEVSD
ncbi:MAG: hypothetical protein GY835_11755 [bacterium]|nr:hypothetical protein [bacterium]